MKFDQNTKKKVARALETLLLADRLGDAHEAGLELARLVFGEKGANAYMAYVDGDYNAFKDMPEFEVLSSVEEDT